MQDYRYSLEKGPRKHVCPVCKQKRFVRYVDNDTGEYLPDKVGRCDREQSCGYHYAPADYLTENPGVEKQLVGRSRSHPVPSRIFQNHDTLPLAFLEKSLKAYGKNRFAIWLTKMFPEKATSLLEKYLVGSSKLWPGATIFWQKDRSGNVRTGKIMLYDSQTGKRVKKPFPHLNWVHAVLLKKGVLEDFQHSQCLFGEHLLTELPLGSKIGLVESEKTAIVMAAIYPSLSWLACGGLQMLKEEICKSLKDFQTICFPDAGCFQAWVQKAAILQQAGFNIRVSDIVERNATETDLKKGWDIADYFLSQSDPPELNEVEEQLAKMGADNPVLFKLMDRFKLTRSTDGQPLRLDVIVGRNRSFECHDGQFEC